MIFRLYRDVISQASRSIATTILIVGLLLIGFGIVILAAPEIFAFLAAMIFFMAGIACAITALKIFWAQRQFSKFAGDDSQAYRRNVQIHVEESHFNDV